MNNELLLLIKKHTDTLFEQPKTRPQEILEFKMKKQMQKFSFAPPLNLIEEGKWLLGVTSFECSNSVFSKTNENNSFLITIPGHWQNGSDEKTIDELNKLLEIMSLEMHLKRGKKRRNQFKKEDSENKLSDLDTQKNEILEELRNVNYNYIEDLVYYDEQLTYDENIGTLDINYIPTEGTGYGLSSGFYKVSDINNSLKYILHYNV